jgi:hypothetical protein
LHCIFKAKQLKILKQLNQYLVQLMSDRIEQESILCRDDRIAWISALSSMKVEQSARGSAYSALDTVMLRANSGFLESNVALHKVVGMKNIHHAEQRLKDTLAELQRSDGLSAPGAAKVEAEFASTKLMVASLAESLQQRDEQIHQLLEERRQLQTEMVTGSQQGPGVRPHD